LSLLFLIVILFGAGLYLLPKPIQNTADPKQILLALQKDLKVTSPISARHEEWLDENKHRVPIVGQEFSLATKANNYVGKYGNFAPYDINSVTEDSLKFLQSSVDKFFISSGFQKNSQNTFRKVYDTGYISLSNGYTKGDMKCLVGLTPITDPFGSFFCGAIDKTQIAWRKELEPAINTNNESGLIVNVDKLVGNYATGGAGGSWWWVWLGCGKD